MLEQNLIQLMICVHDGQLIWQSKSSQMISSNLNPNSIISIEPEQSIIPAHSDSTIVISFDPSQTDQLSINKFIKFNLKTHLIGFISLDKLNDPQVCRNNSLFNEKLRIDVTATVERPR